MTLFMKKRWFSAILVSALAALFMAGLLLVSFHHHDDTGQHSDCNICAAANLITSTVFSCFVLYLFSPVSCLIQPEKKAFLSLGFFPGVSGRSPPA